MTYRTILAYADASDGAPARLRIAATLAARSDAVLDGVFVVPPFIPVPPPAVAGAGYIPPDTWRALMDSHQAVVARAEEDAKAHFTAAVDEAGAQAEWTTLEDLTIHGFIGMARCSDLVVFPISGMASPHLTAMELASESATPLVLVPAAPHTTQVGRKVLVAWNGSREAASALRGAWPILEKTERVEVLMVEPPPEAEAFITKRMERHGVKPRMHISRSPDVKAGEMIKGHAESFVVDLVVMGLYGHSRLREMVLGGASRTMLSQEVFPLLVSR
jgi:nucleotide-binding universal stress UspA family protein